MVAGNLWRMSVCGDGGKVRDSMAALVWPQPAQPSHTIPSPARALASTAGELLGHWPPAACWLPPLPLADGALFTGSHSAAIFTFIEGYQLSFQNDTFFFNNPS